MKRGPNARALAKTLAELKRMGRLELVDEASVQALKSMAKVLDERGTNANLWKVYHVVLERLIADERNGSDAIDRAWADMQSEMGDA